MGTLPRLSMVNVWYPQERRAMPNRRQALGAETELSHAEIAAIAHGHCITARVVADDKAKPLAVN